MRPRKKPKRDEDFMRWSDSEIDLQELLGDYTEMEENDWSSLSGGSIGTSSSEDSSSHEETHLTKATVKSPVKGGKQDSNLKPASQYQCPCCFKILKSIAGFRGHCQRQHSLTGIRATDNRTDLDKSSPINTAEISQPVTPKLLATQIDACIFQALDNIKVDPFLTMEISESENKVFQVVDLFKAHLQESTTTILTPITDVLVALVAKLGSGSTLQLDREALYSGFHRLCTVSELLSDLKATLRGLVPDNLYDSINYMLQMMLNELLSELIAVRTKMELRKSDENNTVHGLTDVVQSTLMYVSGFIVHSLLMKYKRKSYVLEAVACMTIDPSDIKSSRHRAWIERLDRGGLKHPSDELYNVVRQIELLLQTEVDLENLGPNTLAKDRLTEMCLSDFSVQHYWEQCLNGLSGVISEQLLQDVVRIFLNIRGRAVGKKVTRQINQAGQNVTGRKGIRKHLRPSIK